MSDQFLIKQAHLSNHPGGAAWDIEVGSDSDKLWDGIAEGEATVKQFLDSLAKIRDPRNTPFFDDLEKEYGILKNQSIGMQQRIENLSALIYSTRGTGSKSYLQARLHEAGFTDFFVYDNSPAVNPNKFIVDGWEAACGEEESVCGNEDCYCSLYSGGEYVVNGDLYVQDTQYKAAAGNENIVCGNQQAVCGDFQESKELITYQSKDPTDTIPTAPFALTDGDMEDATIPDWDNGSSGNMLPDGNMESSGIEWWTAVLSILSKETSDPSEGTNVLRITANNVSLSKATQSVLEIGVVHTITGVARSDGTNIPQLKDGFIVLWTGTTSTAWQEFDVEFTATTTTIEFFSIVSISNYVEFDDVRITKTNSNLSKIVMAPFEGLQSLRVESINLLADGDSEDPGVAEWNTVVDATVSKSTINPHTGDQAVRVTWASGTLPSIAQSGTVVSGEKYRLTGFVRSDGVVSPEIYDGSIVWTGSLSADWQQFSIEFTPTVTASPVFRFPSVTLGTWCEWDDLCVTEISDLIVDGEMENVGTAEWTADYAVLSKESASPSPFAGDQWLKIENNNIFEGSARQARIQAGKTYRITGAAVSDGSAIPKIYMTKIIAPIFLWTGTTSTDWQSFDFEFFTTDELIIGLLASGSFGEHVGFDSVAVTQIDVEPQSPPSAVHTIEADTRYFLTGQCRSEGLNSPVVKNGDTELVSLDANISWGHIETEFLSTSEELKLTQDTISGRSEWDYLFLYERINDGNWNLIFFVGGSVTTDSEGRILTIESPTVHDALRDSLRRLILRYKPLQTWGALVANFQPNNLVDGEMENSGVTAWASASATLTKSEDSPAQGFRWMQICKTGAGTASASQTALVVGVDYRLVGFAKGDGAVAPLIRDGAAAIFTGTTSEDWQDIDVTFTATTTDIDLNIETGVADDCVGFDGLLLLKTI